MPSGVQVTTVRPWDRTTNPVRAGYAERASPGSTRSVTDWSPYADWTSAAGAWGNPWRSSRSRPSRSALVSRPCASRRETDAVQVAPGASAVHDARTPVEDATENVTPAHVPVGVTPTTRSGVRGSGLTSPVAPVTVMTHDEPSASEHRRATVPPWGSVLGAAPTRRMRRAGATPG